MVEQVVDDPDSLAGLAADAGNARAPWFGEFLTEAHIAVSGVWPPECYPDEPEKLTGEHRDLADRSVVQQWFPRLAAFRRDDPDVGEPELR
ncbi:hypothetical protein [Actinoplanes sp. M2I2]|uniref:hypothetical protein n=1 Tax=Actinoplanes sp. M2I2 TaxID=1734444 RepID=UPI0020220572|nr:hypothetical protein [Actinoplanes sp. M2I2]